MNPVTPSRWRALIPSLTGSICERLEKLFQTNTLSWENHAYKYTESGGITTEYAADICALNCTGSSGPPNPNMPAPQSVNATDGTYSDKIRVSWNAVVAPSGIDAVTQYKVYRSISTNTDTAEATLVGTVDAPTTLLDDPVDADLVVGTIYRYWVVATNGSDTSAYSTSDVGSANAPTADIDAVSDLRAGFGLSPTGGGAISLVWTPPSGAVKYDIHRGTTNVFADSTKIESDIEPTSTTLISSSTGLWDNVGELTYADVPPDSATDYYYWVVAKKDSPPATSTESNEALGRVLPPSIYNAGSANLTYVSPSAVVPGGVDKAWIILFGGGGGGAGGGTVYGGGGGGGSAVVVAAYAVAPGDTIELTTAGPTPDTGNAAQESNGADGTDNEILINAVTTMIANLGGGGQYNAGGAGDGGTAGTGGASGSPTYSVIYNGKPGLPSSGSTGGRSGYKFGGRRLPQADLLTGSPYEGNGADGGPGSGSKAVPIDPSFSVGGKGTAGKAFIFYGA